MNLSERKQIGAYYTPYEAAKVLADWAIESRDEKILEPSFGGCKFLEACRDRLLELGATDPIDNIYGYDIDDLAFSKYLYGEMKINDNNSNFVKKSFLDASSDDFNEPKFNIIIGNPPYISYHSMSRDVRQKAKRICIDNGVPVSGKFSLWMPFVVKSLEFLKNGGKLGFILPNALIESKYSETLIDVLGENFEEVYAIRLKERLFKSHGTNETSVILLCKNYRDSKSSINYKGSQLTIESLRTFLSNNSQEENNTDEVTKSHSYIIPYCEIREVTEGEYVDNSNLLGDFYKISIGLVTGQNDFFIVNKSIIDNYGIEEKYVKFIIKNSKYVPGLTVSLEDIKHLYSINEFVSLVTSDNSSIVSDNFTNYLRTLDQIIIDENKTFRKRHPWHYVKYGEVPACFMTYMIANGPKIIQNRAGITCTNNLYRLFPKEVLSEKQELLNILSVQTSFSQLSAELCGKNYGSGVLKLEPSGAKNIRILKYKGNKNIKGIRAYFNQVNGFLLQGEYEKSMQLADELFINSYPDGNFTKVRDILGRIRKFRSMKNP